MAGGALLGLLMRQERAKQEASAGRAPLLKKERMIDRSSPIAAMNPPQTSIGALTDTELLLVSVIQGKRVLHSILLPPARSDPSGLLEHLWQAELTEAWVMPGTTLSRAATCAWFEQISSSWIVLPHPNVRQPTRPDCVLLWPKDRSAGRRLVLIFPEHAGWGWALADTRSLLATVTYLEQALGRPISDSPALVAHHLLTELTRDHPPSHLRPAPVDLHTLQAEHGATVPLKESARDLAWMRPLTLAEQRQRYLHKFTHLSGQLEGCLSVRLGAGAPEYSPTGRAYDGIRPGIWRVHVERAGSVFDGKGLPGCLDGEWMSTPQVRCCQDISYHVEVREGYSWSRSYDLLAPWARTLWQAAERLHTHPQSYRHPQGRANAAQAIRLLAQLGVAVLARGEAEGGWARPDWLAQVVGRSRAMLFTHLAGLARKGVMPVLVIEDALWVVSDDPNPLTAGAGLVATHRWRGYTSGYEVPLLLSSEVKAVFRSAESPDQVMRTLDSLAGGGES